MQQNDISIDNIMFLWESNRSPNIGMCNWGCALHMNENVESLWHVETEEAKDNLKNEKWWVGSMSSRVQSRKHEYLSKYYSKEVESFTIDKLAWQLYDKGYHSIFYIGEGYIF